LRARSGENGLRHVLREVGVAIDLPERGGIDEVDVALHQFGKGRLGTGRGVALEQFGVSRHFQVIAPAKTGSAQKIIGRANGHW